MDAIINRDAATLFRYVRPEEIRAAGLTVEKLQSLLDFAVGDRLRDFGPEGERKLQEYPLAEAVFLSQTIRHPDGREFLLGVGMQKSVHGPKLKDSAVFILVLYMVVSKVPAGEPGPIGPAKSKFFAEEFEALRPDLERMGIQGFIRQRNTGLEYLTWSQYIEEQRRRAVSPTPSVG